MSNSDEWYTPIEYLERVRKVFGGRITLDPASSDEAQTIVKAERYYTKEENGLIKRWEGSVYCNPPYSKPIVWVDKAIEEYKRDKKTEIIMLLNASTDTKWFHSALTTATGCCLTRGRISFWRADDRKISTNRQGQVFFYWGHKNRTRFNKVFSDVGSLVELSPL